MRAPAKKGVAAGILPADGRVRNAGP